MKAILRFAAAAAVFLSSSIGADAASSTKAFVQTVAQAAALGEFCVNWAIDQVAVSRLLRERRIPVNGRYRDIFGAAYARAHADGKRGGDYPAACDKALDLYGPHGRKLSGLVGPVWNGACGDCPASAVVVVP